MVTKKSIPLIILCFVSLSLYATQDITYRAVPDTESGIQAECTLESPAEDIWALLTDYQNSGTIMPNIEKTTVLEKEKNETLVKTTVKQSVFTMTYTSKMREDKQQYLITWSQVEGPFSKNSGSWKLKPVDETTTKVVYTIELDHPLMPASVRSSLIKKSIPDMYGALQRNLDH